MKLHTHTLHHHHHHCHHKKNSHPNWCQCDLWKTKCCIFFSNLRLKSFYNGNCVRHRLHCDRANECAPTLNISASFVNVSIHDDTHVRIVYRPSYVDNTHTQKGGIYTMMIAITRQFFLLVMHACSLCVCVCVCVCMCVCVFSSLFWFLWLMTRRQYHCQLMWTAAINHMYTVRRIGLPFLSAILEWRYIVSNV